MTLKVQFGFSKKGEIVRTQTVWSAYNNTVNHRENEKGNIIPRLAAHRTIFLFLLKEGHELKGMQLIL